MILPHQTFKITLQQNSCAMLHCCLLGVRQQIFYFLCPHPDFKYIHKTVYLDHLYCDVSYDKPKSENIHGLDTGQWTSNEHYCYCK